MTTIQDRIIKDFRKILEDESQSIYWTVESGKMNFEIPRIEQFLIQSIKEVEEETRKEIINHIDFFADQSRWFVDEDNGVGPIIQTRVISVEDLQKELLSITNKEIKK